MLGTLFFPEKRLVQPPAIGIYVPFRISGLGHSTGSSSGNLGFSWATDDPESAMKTSYLSALTFPLLCSLDEFTHETNNVVRNQLS